MSLFSGLQKTMALPCFAEFTSVSLEYSWKLPGSFQELSRKDPGKHGGNPWILHFSPSWKLPGGQPSWKHPGRMLDGWIFPGSFQDASRKTGSEYPVRLEVSWKTPGGTAGYPGIRISNSDIRPVRLEDSWKLPGKVHYVQEDSRQTGPGNILSAWKIPGSFQEPEWYA